MGDGSLMMMVEHDAVMDMLATITTMMVDDEQWAMVDDDDGEDDG